MVKKSKRDIAFRFDYRTKINKHLKGRKKITIANHIDEITQTEMVWDIWDIYDSQTSER